MTFDELIQRSADALEGAVEAGENLTAIASEYRQLAQLASHREGI